MCVSQLEEEVSHMPNYRIWSTTARDEVPQRKSSCHSCIQRAHQEDVSLVGVSTAAPGIPILLHCIQDALEPDWG
jgi:hypothetical protein